MDGFLKSKQGNALVKIALWFIFILIILIIFSFGGKKEEEVVVERFKNYDEMISDLSNGYMYNYKVVSDGLKTYYRGIMCNNVDKGYKEDENGIVRYINDDIIVMDNKTEKLELEVNLSKLFESVKTSNYSITKYEDKREIEYKDLGYSFKVETNLENIEKIKINKEKEYVLEFTNVGICGKIGNN